MAEEALVKADKMAQAMPEGHKVVAKRVVMALREAASAEGRAAVVQLAVAL